MENTAKRKYPEMRLFVTRLAIFTAAMICLIASNSQAFAANDDYLSSLEGEASSGRSTAVKIAQSSGDYMDELSTESESTAHVPANAQHDPEYDKNLAAMEKLLKIEKPSTYKFYKKLYPKYKAQVFERYAADKSDQQKRLSKIQKNVMGLYFKQ